MISNKNLDPNSIKIDKKSYKNILIHYNGHVASKNVKVLYFINKKINGYIEYYNGNKYLVHLDEKEDALKSMKSYEKEKKQKCY